ncbi:MAG: response regulator [Bacteroidetes bacterium]|nr:MAG: response regulator [Bacteroidota bacterium]
MNAQAKILVVDDEPDLELLITQRFRKKIRENEFAFDFAHNGTEALEFLSDEPDKYDMILTDINMPEMDGLTLLVKIKERFRHQRAVVVSAYGDMDNIRTAMNRGAFDFITKPIDFADLETTIEKTLEENRILRMGRIASEQLNQTLKEKEIAEIERHKAEQSEKFKQQFLANMSHEIRTPMNSVIGLTHLLLKTQLDDQQQKYLNVIRKSSENLLVIINDILDLSKIEAGKMDFEKIPFHLHDHLDTVYQTMLFKAEDKNLEFSVTVDEGVPPILIGDPVRLNQILINLSGNAIKFTNEGKIKINVKELSRKNEQSILEFSVSDSGIGIAPEKLNKIFESFSQASSDTTRRCGGTGLGLTISKQLIELQGGSIGVQSELNKGTTFYFKLPFIIGTQSDLKKSTDHQEEFSAEELQGIKVLLVEDNHFNQMVAVDTLTDLITGIKVDVADNGLVAFEMLKTEDYDVVLMDIQMPVMDGFEACRKIKSELPEPKNRIPVMAMTANVTQEEVQKCFEFGMNEYISKPFDPKNLLNKLGKLVLAKNIQ